MGKKGISIRVNVACAYCGSILEKCPSEVKFNKTKTFFCSQDCFHEWQGGSNNFNWNGGKAILPCEYCGNEIIRKTHEVKKYRRHFCSPECRELGKRTLIDVECESCGKIIQKPKSYVDKYRHMFCCRKCRHIWMRGENNPAWNGGTKTEPYCQIWLIKDFREEIKDRDSNMCINPYCVSDDKTFLSLHHINYDKKDCNPKNLITVCRSCNSRANIDREWHQEWYQEIMSRRYGYEY